MSNNYREYAEKYNKSIDKAIKALESLSFTVEVRIDIIQALSDLKKQS